MNKSFSRQKNVFYKIPDSSVNDSYNEQLSYDKNGNILTLKRNGEDETEFYTFMIDDLDYDYDGNQLRNVTDTSGALQGFNDGNKHMQTKKNDFEYDDYGNMVIDRNKGITNITYNHLNLPKKITFENNQSIEYLYAADGSKLRKTVTEGSTNKTVDYLDGFQYRNALLDFFPTVEGYVRSVPIDRAGIFSFHYIYNYTDHLGNIRLKYTKHPQTGNIQILEENSYYPFGLKHEGYNPTHEIIEVGEPMGQVTIIPVTEDLGDPYKFKFNGMELQTELGLEFYDFGMRNYDPAIGRWMNIDPMAEAMRRHSPYNYAFDNPVFWIDPDGMAPIATTETNSLKINNSSDNGGSSGGDPIKQNPQFPFTSGEQKLEPVNLGVIESTRSSITKDGITIYGDKDVINDSEASSGIVTGLDRGSGSVEIGGADINPLNTLLQKIVNFFIQKNKNPTISTTPSSMEKENKEPVGTFENNILYTVQGELQPNSSYGINVSGYGGTSESYSTKDYDIAKKDSLRFVKTGLFKSISVRRDTLNNK